MKDNNLYLDC